MNEIIETPQLNVVIIAVLTAVIVSYAALQVSARMIDSRGGRRKLWLVSGALVMAVGIWSMHMIAMMSLHREIPIDYNGWLMSLSFVAACMGAFIAFGMIYAAASLHGVRLMLAGITMGISITGMHYLGMASMENVTIVYDVPLVLLSLIVSIAASAAALRCFHIFPSWPSSRKKQIAIALSALMLGLAISATHYLGVSSARFYMETGVSVVNETRSGAMTVIIGLLAFITQGVLILVAFYDQRVVSQAVKLRDKEQRYRSLVDHSVDAIFTVDLKGRFLNMNDTGVEWSGLSLSEWQGMGWENLFQEEAVDSTIGYFRQVVTEKRALNFNTAITAKDMPLHLNVTLIPLYLNEELDGVLGIARNITDQVIGEQNLQEVAHHDLLTGFPNRRYFLEELEDRLSRTDEPCALFFLDMNRFKIINDSLGHTIGDHLLRAVASRLRDCIGETGFLARLGGDEFTIFMPTGSSPAFVQQQAQELLDAFKKPLLVKGHTLSTSISVGIAVSPEDGRDADTLMKHADMAMYASKKKKPNSFTFFHQELAEASEQILQKEEALQQGLDKEEFFLEYQPRISCHDRQIVGVEALVRWKTSDGVVHLPGQFIPLAENNGKIIPLGAYILDMACRQAKRWQEKGMAIPVAVNLSAEQFKSMELVSYIEALLKKYQLPPHLLELEVTESMTMNYIEHSVQMLHELRTLGVSLAIDDFGMGYSSLSYLKDFPIQRLKLDRTFVQGIQKDPKTEKITQAIIALGHYLDLEITAEGAETAEQVEYLEAHRCSDIQGFYFSRPLSIEELEKKYLNMLLSNKLS